REALDMVLDPNVQTGLLEGMTSAPGEYPAWYRVFPTGAPVSFYGHLSVVAPVEGQTPFIAVDGYPARGNLTGLESLQNVDLIHVTGQFHPEEGMMVLEIQSWQPYAGYEDGLQGTLQKQGGEIVLVTAEGQTLLLPDMPAEVPLPLENAFVLGVQEGGTFQWKSIDLRMTGGGGGGGGSGLGLYRLNLSGTPVPFPTATPVLQPTPLATGEGAQYTVQAGDTFASIAAAFGITQEALMQANGVTDAGTLFMGQVLLVPGSTAQQVDGWHGLLIITLLAQPDGSQQTQYGFVADGGTGFYVLDGDLSGLAAYHNRPVTLWGVIGSEELNGSAVIHVDRYEIPYPDLAFTILRGIESNQTVNGDMLTLLTTADGQIYVMLSMDGMAVGSPVEPGSEDRLVEALMIPGESYAGHPAIRVFSKAMATNPKNGQPMELPVTADQPYVQEARPAGAYNPPTAAIEKVELVYFITDPRYKPPEPGAGPAYIQPVWRFSGRYSNGDVFEILVQALRRDFLSPEIEYVEPPG
ncbi:MAG: LysM peptidoglycan-binding domain-containing protein, partial [Bacteroidota bacterium]